MLRRPKVSIFDEYQAQACACRSLQWIPAPSFVSIDPSNFLFEGNLCECSMVGVANSRHYILTRTMLISTSIPTAKDSVLGDLKKKSSDNYYAYLINPRIEKIKYHKKHGFCLSNGTHTLELLCESKEDMANWFNYLKEVAILENLEADYALGEVIGSGSSARVRMAKRLENRKIECAVKSIPKKKLIENPHTLKYLMNEISILRILQHPNIIKLQEVYEAEDFVHLVFEFIRGGDLQARMKAKRRFAEQEAAQVMQKLLETVAFFHEEGIIHRDIKPGNIILGKEGDLKLIDFGLGIIGTYCLRRMPLCGSPGYIAPEILLDQPFEQKADIYSCGIVLYFMLAGELPFPGSTVKEVLAHNRKNDIKFKGYPWDLVSKEVKDLILDLTDSDPDTRPTAPEALESPWFNKILKNSLVPQAEANRNNSAYTPDSYSCYNALVRSINCGISSVKDSITKESSEEKAAAGARKYSLESGTCRKSGRAYSEEVPDTSDSISGMENNSKGVVSKSGKIGVQFSNTSMVVQEGERRIKKVKAAQKSSFAIQAQQITEQAY